MTKRVDENGKTIPLGDPGSFTPNYEESIELIEAMFPQNKKIVVMSTAGVESTYLMNLLIQLGYDFNVLYNVGGFSNSAVGFKSYREIADAKYKVPPTELPETTIQYHWNHLTLIKE